MFDKNQRGNIRIYTRLKIVFALYLSATPSSLPFAPIFKPPLSICRLSIYSLSFYLNIFRHSISLKKNKTNFLNYFGIRDRKRLYYVHTIHLYNTDTHYIRLTKGKNKMKKNENSLLMDEYWVDDGQKGCGRWRIELCRLRVSDAIYFDSKSICLLLFFFLPLFFFFG